jgi:hypothetical protein
VQRRGFIEIIAGTACQSRDFVSITANPAKLATADEVIE